MTAYPRGPENGATPGSDLWTEETVSNPQYPTSARPQAGFESGAERVAAASGNPPSVGSTSAAGHEAPAPSAALPALSILHEDEFELLKRIERLETLVANQEAVIAMCVTVATKAAEQAGAREDA